MKRSRIICSIITVIYSVLLLFVFFVLVRSKIEIETSISMYIKAIHVALFGACVLAYMVVKKKLNKKVKSATLIYSYRYLYLAVLVFISRLGIAYIMKSKTEALVLDFVPCFSKGLGSYLLCGIEKLVGNQMYAIVIINTLITFACVILIKRLVFSITSSDMLSASASMLYILLPQSLYYSTIYNRYNFNLIFILLGLLVLTKIIDEVKQYKLKSRTYIYMTFIVSLMAVLDILFGGSFVLWIVLVWGSLIASRSIDIAHMFFGDKIKEIVLPKFNRIIYALERINIPKLVNVAIIITVISLSSFGIIHIFSSSSNFYNILSFSTVMENITSALMHSRTYYIIIICATLLLELTSVILKRKDDLKMVLIKLALIATTILVAYTKTGGYTACVFDTMLIITLVINICNIYYNREDKIKLLQEKNRVNG